MAFTTEIIFRSVVGDKVMVVGTYTNTAGSTGGDVATGLRRIENFNLQATGAAVVADVPVPNETFPLDSGDVTIVTTADEVGLFQAFGF